MVCFSYGHWQPHPLATLPANAAVPVVRVQQQYYSIQGNTVQELRSQMNRSGPMDQREGRRYDARTDWAVRWTYHYSPTSNGCTIDAYRTEVDVTVILPRWQQIGSAPRSLVGRWNRYMNSLQAHENGHQQHGIAAGRDVLQTLATLPSASSCQQLEASTRRALHQVIARYNQQDVSYDRTTHHGRTQGAVFP